jgi:hypothetical protein
LSWTLFGLWAPLARWSSRLEAVDLVLRA